MSDRPYPPGDYPVVVVGTGPGGLQLSYELRRVGIEHALISQDEGPAGMFRRFPLFHRLNTSSRRFAIVPRESMAFYRYDWNSLVSDVPEHRALVPDFMDGEHYFPRRVEMHDALVTFAERAGIDARYDCRWESTRQEDGGFVLGTTDGDYRCQIAVFAVGMSDPWRPPTPGIELVSHYDDLKDRAPESFEGKKIFIIGKRNSAFEIADSLLPWAAQLILGSPHHVRPSIITGVPTPPRARYVEVLEDHLFGGGSFVVDCAIDHIEQTSDGWRVHAEGTTNPGSMVFDVDEVIATTGFGTPLGDLRELGVETFYKDRLPTQTPFWESTSCAGDLLRRGDHPGSGRPAQVRISDRLCFRWRLPPQRLCPGRRDRTPARRRAARARRSRKTRSSRTSWSRRHSRVPFGASRRTSREWSASTTRKGSATRASCRSRRSSTREESPESRSPSRPTRRTTSSRRSTCAARVV